MIPCKGSLFILQINGGVSLKNKHILATFVIILCLFVISPVLAISNQSQEEIKVYVNGDEISFPDQKPIINTDNRTLVPVRFISETLGAEVDWNNQTRTVRISYEDNLIVLPVGKKQATVGIKEVTLDTKADIVNERTMVPLRFISECLGTEVQWNGALKEIYISTKMPPANPFVGQSFRPSDLPCDGGITGGTLIAGSDLPSAKIMYAELEDLPIRIGEYIIYKILTDEKNIKITQFSGWNIPEPIDLFMIENNYLTRNRCYDFAQKGKLFTYSYPITSILDDTPTDISKISDFALFTRDGMEFRMLVIPNPSYKG